MKKIMLTALAILPMVVLAQGGNFLLKAKIGNGSSPEKAYLIYRGLDKLVTDSAIVNQGNFEFKGTLTDPRYAKLILDHQGIGLKKLNKNADVDFLYLEKGTISITSKDSIKNALVTGSRINDDNLKYNAYIMKPVQEIKILKAEYTSAPANKKQDENYAADLQVRINKLMDEKRELQKEYIKNNPTSYFSLLALMDLSESSIDVQLVQSLYQNLSAEIREYAVAKSFLKMLDATRATAVGVIAPDFTQNDVNDKPVSLKDFRGKYVLLDFWASWCPPCREENPNIVKAFNQYKDKNFTVLGVSLDRPNKKADWLAAIKADGLEWTQVSDLKFWDNEVAKEYGIQSIPQNCLIDPDGKIIGRNLRGEKLQNKLASLFK